MKIWKKAKAFCIQQLQSLSHKCILFPLTQVLFLGLNYISSIEMKVYANATTLSSWKSHLWTTRANQRLSLWILLVRL